MRSAARHPCDAALTIPVNDDTHLLFQCYITQRGGSLVEFDSWVSVVRHDFHSQTHTVSRVESFKRMQTKSLVFPCSTCLINLKIQL